MLVFVRMVFLEYKKVEIKSGDLVIIFVYLILGNEKLILRVINFLFEKGVEVVYSDIVDIYVFGYVC